MPLQPPSACAKRHAVRAPSDGAVAQPIAAMTYNVMPPSSGARLP